MSVKGGFFKGREPQICLEFALVFGYDFDMKAVFVTKVGSGYDDVIEKHYHFPKTYLSRVEQTVGDLIIYYEPRSQGGNLSYFAVAQVTGIQEDKVRENHYYARIDGFLNFDREVHFSNDGIYEKTFLNEDGSFRSGAQSNAVRLITNDEFNAIVSAGFSAHPPHPDKNESLAGFEEEQETFKRPIVEQLISKPFRSSTFRRQVQAAYGLRCAVTGLRIINSKGHSEVHAAHIRPVELDGTDSVRNGIALSRTAHWMFDNGLISLNDDFSIITAHAGIPEKAKRLLLPDRKAIVPINQKLQPHPKFLEYHRDVIFES